MNYFRLI